jgi:hypothetical protein|tara:strand:+ start:695 stop:1000 length:306 start_codon:yes stop_codon:yes gene_type:complete
MALIDTVTKFDFIDRMWKIHDNGKNGAYSIEGLEVLWDWLDGLEYGHQEFYPADISCTWNEFKNLKEFQDNYTDEYEDLDDIRDISIVLEIDDEAFLVSEF